MHFDKMRFERDGNGYYRCLERENGIYCNDDLDCRFCVDGKHISEVREMWRDFLTTERAGRSYADVFDSFTDWQFEEILDRFPRNRVSNPVFMFEYAELYDQIARELPDRYQTVIDFGCSLPVQGRLFPNVRYIGVDNDERVDVAELVMLPSNEFYLMPAQEFIYNYAHEFDQYSTLALCCNVPDEEVRNAVKQYFENHFVLWFGNLI